jgi:hypothetical protein
MATNTLNPDRLAQRIFVWTVLYAGAFAAVAGYIITR